MKNLLMIFSILFSSTFGLYSQTTSANKSYPKNDEELVGNLNQIKDSYEKIKYLNSVICQVSTLPKSIENNQVLFWSYWFKLAEELPTYYDNPLIPFSEWQDNLQFIQDINENFGLTLNNYQGKMARGLFLYFKVCLKQKVNGSPDLKDLQLIVSEFSESNFPITGGFYNNCLTALNPAKNISNSTKPRISKEEFKKHVIYDNTSTTECVLCHRTVYCTKRTQSDLDQEIDFNYSLVIEQNFRLNIFENLSKGVKDPDATFVKTYKCDSHCADCKVKYGFTH